MRATRSRAPRAATADSPEDSFEEIREAFCARLQSERTHFLALNSALRRTDESPTSILDELRNRAHRLSGTAAIFEFAGVATAARALELAVVSASASLVKATEPAIGRALDALVRLIGDLKEDPHPTHIAVSGSGPRRARAILHG